MTKRRARPVPPSAPIVLVMIVRDEAAILPERLAAIHPYIDAWVVVDTGSVDDTEQVVHAALDDLDGVLFDHTWAGFADARTAAVRLAAEQYPAGWALLLDADTIVHIDGPSWRPATDVDVIEAEVIHGPIRYWHPRLIRLAAGPWRWRGVLHEYLEVPVQARSIRSAALRVEHGSGGARSANPMKYRADAELLAKARADGTEPDLDARYCFYEAQSWADAGEPTYALHRYAERMALGGFYEERFIACLRAGELYWDDGQPERAIDAWHRAWAVDPTRAEPLIALAAVMRTREMWAPAFEFARLAQDAVRCGGAHGMFADVNVLWRADFEMSVAAWWIGEKWLGRKACDAVLSSTGAPPAVLDRTRSNLTLYVAG